LINPPTLPSVDDPTRRGRGASAAALLLVACAFAASGWAQSSTGGGDASSASADAAIAPADIPARADADEKFVQAVLRRSQVDDKVRRFEQTLADQAAALSRLNELNASTDLTTLSVSRLESLERYWQLNERAVSQTRIELARATNSSSEDAAELATRRAAWQATRETPNLSPALLQRADELKAQIDRAQRALAGPLSKMLDLGRKSNALSIQFQTGLAEVARQVEEQDRRLAVLDSPPLWQAVREVNLLEPVGAGLRRNVGIELHFARAYDAVHTRMLTVLVTVSVLLLPLILWLRRRARALVTAGQASEASVQALSRPWAAWLLLVAGGAVLYDFQGPILRQQMVMLLAWIPVLGLLRRRILNVVGPWAYLSALFYFLNVVISLLVSHPVAYRVLLLALNMLMLVTLAWHIWRATRPGADREGPLQTRAWIVLSWIACLVLLVAAGSNIFGNTSLSAMLTSATLNSSYAALAMFAGSKVVVALFRVLFAGPTVSKLAERHSASLIPAIVNLGRTVLVGAWLVFTLQSFRVYRPLSTFLASVLTHEFGVGELSLTLGGLAAFAAATWLAFWLAKTIRLVLSEDVLPALSLPRGVGNSISSLSYYTILVLGLLAALAAAGFHVGQLAIVFGALGVGIGFGLRDVVMNFVSGLILMFERPIQRGDTVLVAGIDGVVREIGLRATILTTFDGADVIVPNGMLLADKLVNWTLNGTRRRVNIDVSTDYAADPTQTMALLVQIASSVDGVSHTPAPAAIMTGLAPGALQFNVRAWTTDRADWLLVRSTLAVKIRDGLAEAGIEVPKPQLDLHVRGAGKEAIGPAIDPSAPGAPSR